MQEVSRQAVLTYFANENSQNGVKMEMSPSAFNPNVCFNLFVSSGPLGRRPGSREHRAHS